MNVGIIGKMGSGKTTAANFLVEKYGFVKMGLADPIRLIVRDYFGIESKADPRYRRLMQKVGTDWFRSADPDVWVKYLLRSAEKENKPIVVDDVRFPNEALALSCQGWKLVYLDCPYKLRETRCRERDKQFDHSTVNHPSETGVDDILRLVGNGLPCGGSWIVADASRDAESVNRAIEELLFCT